MIKALIIGVGGAGQKILTHLKADLQLTRTLPPSIKLWSIDIDTNRAYEVLGVSLAPSELYQCGNLPPTLETILGNIREYPVYGRWLDHDIIRNRIDEANRQLVRGAGQYRPIGRAGIFLNAAQIVASIERFLGDLRQIQPAGEPVDVWIVGSAAGGTGAGIIIDTAMLTHLAHDNLRKVGRGLPSVRVRGLLVLSEAFTDVASGNLGRSYAFLAELFRFQTPLIERDKLLKAPPPATSDQPNVRDRVDYPSASFELGEAFLLNSLVCVDEPCNNEEERRAFYRKVAAGLALFVDDGAGPAFNSAADNLSNAFAAARVRDPVLTYGTFSILLPAHLYARKFAADQVLRFVRGVAKPNPQGGLSLGLPEQRAAEALEILKAIAPPLDRLRELDEHRPQLLDGFYRQYLERTSIAVDQLLEGAALTAPQEKAPFEALKKQVYADVKTFSERRKTPDVGKTVGADNRLFDESMLRSAKNAFYGHEQTDGDMAGGESNAPGSLNHALTRVFDRVRARYLATLDTQMTAYLNGGLHDRPGGDVGRLGMAQALCNALSTTIAAIRAQKLGWIKTRLPDRAQSRGEVLTARNRLFDGQILNQNKSVGGFFGMGGADPSDYQEKLRDAEERHGDNITRHKIFERYEQTIDALDDRVKAWRDTLNAWANALCNDPQSVERQKTADLDRAVRELDQLVRTPSCSVGLPPGDRTMGGYEDILRRECCYDSNAGREVHESWLAESRWSASAADPHTAPQLRLTARLPTREGPGDFSVAEVTGELTRWMEQYCETRIRQKNVMEYLAWCVGQGTISWTEIGQRIRPHVAPLLRPSGKDVADVRKDALKKRYIVVYRSPAGGHDPNVFNPADPNKTENTLAGGLSTAAGAEGAVEVEANHQSGDSMALTVISMQGFDARMVAQFDVLRDYYLNSFAGDEARSNYAVYLFHAFRGGREAWEIVKASPASQTGRPAETDLIDPRVVRSLDHPRRAWLFARALVTGKIAKDSDGRWCFAGAGGRTHVLAGGGREDFLSAYYRFAMADHEHRPRSTLSRVFEQEWAAVRDEIEKGGGWEVVKKQLGLALDTHLQAPSVDPERDQHEVTSVRRVLEYYAGRELMQVS